jgi:hypothetical protein
MIVLLNKWKDGLKLLCGILFIEEEIVLSTAGYKYLAFQA